MARSTTTTKTREPYLYKKGRVKDRLRREIADSVSNEIDEEFSFTPGKVDEFRNHDLLWQDGPGRNGRWVEED